MSQLPADICNQSLDAAGIEFTLGDIEEGTRPAQVLLRAYGQCLRQLLRAAHWDFARKAAPLELLADLTGQTPNVGTMVAGNGLSGIYEYAYPIDGAKARFIPWNWNSNAAPTPPGNIAPSDPTAPITTGTVQPALVGRIVPARFTISTDPNYPPPPGEQFWEVQGVSPQGRTVIITNVKDATLVYTAQMIYPSVWDAQFRAAFVSYLASEIVLPLQKDKKLGMVLQDRLIKVAQGKIAAARATNGNEGVSSSDLAVDWMNARYTGGFGNQGFGWGGGPGGPGAGMLSCGWDQCAFANGSAY